MNPTYRALAEFAQTLWPSRQRQFDEDARIPLSED